MNIRKRCLVTLSCVYAIAFVLNVIPSVTFPDTTIGPLQATSSVLLVLCMMGTCVLNDRVAKLYVTALLFAGVTVFTLHSFETYVYDIVILDALFAIQYPLYLLFVTPLFGLNLFFNVEADFIALFAFFIGLFILAIHEIALVVSRRMT